LRFSRVKKNVHLLNKISSEGDGFSTFFMFHILIMVSGGNKILAGTAASGRGLSDVENTKFVAEFIGIVSLLLRAGSILDLSGGMWE
jgi:hypothetical protein